MDLNRDWKRVIFSDETHVVVDSSNRIYVWRRPDEVQTVSSVRFHTTQNLSVTAVISFSWSTISSFIFTTFTLIESLQKF
jgi:hypothetical protein